MKKILAIILFLILGCATVTPTKEQLANANYGKYPKNYLGCSKSYLSWTLIDPISVVYSNWEEPQKGWAKEINKEGYVFGYIVCLNINDKNKMGKYVGDRKTCVFIKNENVMRYLGNYPKGTLSGEWANTNCV